MRAVNLIPVEERRSASAPARTGVTPYLLLGVLAVIVAGLTAFVVTSNTVSSRKTELSQTILKANAAEAEAAAVKPYADFEALKQARLTTVQSLAHSRFDWHGILDQLARAIPNNVWLTSLTGTVSSDVSLEGASGSGARGTADGPAIDIVGCTKNHKDVARMMTRMRLIEGVNRVALSDSTKSDNSTAASGAAAGCSGADAPQFSMTIFFDAIAAADTSTSAATGASTTTASTGATP